MAVPVLVLPGSLRRYAGVPLIGAIMVAVVAAQASAVVASAPDIRREAALLPRLEGYGPELRVTPVVPIPTALAATVLEPGLRGAVAVTNVQTTTTSSSASTTVGTTAVSGATAFLEVPAAALPTGAVVQVGAVTDPRALLTASPPPEGAAVLAGFQISAASAGGARITGDFAQPVPVRFSLPPSEVPSGTGVGTVELAFWNGAEWVVQPAAITPQPDGTIQVTTRLVHFTLFALLAQPSTPFAGAFPPPGRYDTMIWDGLTGTSVTAVARLGGPNVRAIYIFDAASRHYLTHIEGAPASASDSFTLRNGQLFIVLAAIEG